MKLTPRQSKELSRVVRNFNAKVTRLTKKGGELIPSKVSVRQLKNSLANKNRQDFHRELNRLKRFTRRGSEELVTVGDREVTRWERREVAIAVSTAKRAIRRQLKNLNIPVENLGKPVGFTRGYINSSEVRTLIEQYNDLSVSKILQTSARSRRLRSIEQANKYTYRYSNQALFRLKENLQEMVSSLSLPNTEYTKELKDAINKKLSEIQIKDFKRVYYANIEISDIIIRYHAERDGELSKETDDVNTTLLERVLNILGGEKVEG